MTKPIAVLISDIHFTPGTLELADASLCMAADYARKYDLPLVICGDTLDTKDVMRGVCVNKLLNIIRDYADVIILVGNHDLVNEKGDEHTLNFLRPFAIIVDKPEYNKQLGSWLIPYQNDANKLKELLESIPPGSRLIMHQGLKTAFLGHYVQDQTSLPPEAYANFRVISGHYHRQQDIKCGDTGVFSYIGNPYTLSFGEAHDGAKGFQVLNNDGSLTFVPTNLRKHIVIERAIWNVLQPVTDFNPGDLVWLKISGPQTELTKLNKKDIGLRLFGHSNFKMDLIPTDSTKLDTGEIKENAPNGDILDTLIDGLPESDTSKSEIKALWRELMSK